MNRTQLRKLMKELRYNIRKYPTGKPSERKSLIVYTQERVPYSTQISEERLLDIIALAKKL